MHLITFLKNIAKQVRKGNFFIVESLKYYPEWSRSLSKKHSSIIDQQPWITYDAIRLLEKIITVGASIFEYGGGGSTLFFLTKQPKQLVTIEHDKEWFRVLKEIVDKKRFKNWDSRLIEAEKSNTTGLDITNPDHYFSDDVNFKGSVFKSYVQAIDEFPDQHFDIVMIDGRARTSCIKHAVNKVKKQGYLILDNSERKYYTVQQQKLLDKQFTLILSNFTAVPYSTSFSQTSVWQKK